MVVHAQEEIKRLTTNLPFSILVDETPDVNGRALLAVMLSTASFIVVLKIIILDGGATFNGERLATHVSQVMQDYELNAAKYFVGFVADNVSFAETAFQLLKESFPGIIKINCMAHILNLISKEVTSIEYWPRTHAVLNALKQYLGSQHSSEQRGRQQRFHQHFKFSAHNTFNFIETRWSEWLQVLVYVSDHHRQLSLFIDSEKEHLYC